MKVIQINSECGRGSTGKIAVAISDVLSDKGIENYIFYSGNHRSDYKKGWMISGKVSIRIHQILSRIFGNQGFHSYFATKRLVKRLKTESADVILLHNIHGYYIHLDVLFAFLKDFEGQVYWTLHDCWAFTGHCTHFTIAQCEKWKKGCYDCPQKHKYPYSWFFDCSKELYEKKKQLFTGVNKLTLIAPSIWIAEKLKASYLSKIPTIVIPNGIDLQIFQPTNSQFRQKNGIEDKTLLLGVSSVWSEAKGLDIFIKLAEILDQKKFQIVLVGTDDEVDKLLPKQIFSIHRTQNQKELAEIYTAADVFINPTREDNYPSVNMEAIACGTPVVSFDTGGCKEIISNGCGIVVKENRVEDLLDALSEVLDHLSDYRKNCAENKECFNQKDCFEKYAKMICS